MHTLLGPFPWPWGCVCVCVYTRARPCMQVRDSGAENPLGTVNPLLIIIISAELHLVTSNNIFLTCLFLYCIILTDTTTHSTHIPQIPGWAKTHFKCPH